MEFRVRRRRPTVAVLHRPSRATLRSAPGQRADEPDDQSDDIRQAWHRQFRMNDRPAELSRSLIARDMPNVRQEFISQ